MNPSSVLALKAEISEAEISKAAILNVPEPASDGVNVKVSAVEFAIDISIARSRAELRAALPIV